MGEAGVSESIYYEPKFKIKYFFSFLSFFLGGGGGGGGGGGKGRGGRGVEYEKVIVLQRIQILNFFGGGGGGGWERGVGAIVSEFFYKECKS